MGSQLIVKATDAVDAETVVDYCAGNGGKTLALATIMGSKSTNKCIFAHDVAILRLKQLLGSLARAQVNENMIQAVCTSASYQTLEIKDENILPQFPSSFLADVVLVDAPCSSIGVLRRRPSQRWMVRKDEIFQTLPQLQKDILEKASKLVRKGGRLVYSTCSIAPSENQEVARTFELGSEWEPWDFDESEWEGYGEQIEKKNWRIILPNEHCDGFFIARWQRK